MARPRQPALLSQDLTPRSPRRTPTPLHYPQAALGKYAGGAASSAAKQGLHVANYSY